MKWHIRYDGLILLTASESYIKSHFHNVYARFGKLYEVVNDQIIKQEKWEF